MTMEKCLIVAIADNNAIGRKNQLLWSLPEDMKYFKEQTTGHPVIMGWMTYQSIGRPLPRRTNIVISIFPWPDAPEKVVVVESLDEAFAAAQKACESAASAETPSRRSIRKSGIRLLSLTPAPIPPPASPTNS